ncbi:MAG: biotin--[acetyl-CoA-carboxylase] ligase [Thermogutta sp.]
MLSLDTPFCIPRILSDTFLAGAEYLEVIDSTNNRAKVLAASNQVPLPYLVLAEEQSAGRGRGSNRWWTGKGSLAFSIIVALPSKQTVFTIPPINGEICPTVAGTTDPYQSIGLLGLAGALAVYRAVKGNVPNHLHLGIHWPNDVYANGAKLAGVLVEVTANRRVVVGIGVNVNNQKDDAPPDLLDRIVTLRELSGQILDRTTLLIDIVNQLEKLLGMLITHPSQLAEEADQACLQKGRELALEVGPSLITGKCMGIDPTGALLLQTELGEQRFLSGVVVAVE